MSATGVEHNQTDRFYSRLNLPIFIGANLIIILAVLVALFHSNAEVFFNTIQDWITDNLSWYYLLAVGIMLGAFIFAAVSRYGNIKLGPDHSEPAYSNTSWFAMLFSTGMGIGIMFFGVAEPVLHYLYPPAGDAETAAAAKEAMNITFFHWGLHAWAIYGVMGLILAYFSFRMNLPLAVRSALYPIIGERIYGRWGDTIDIFAVVGTVFGVATTLGFGVVQINTGLNYLFPSLIEVNANTQMVLIVITTAAATLSVSLGLDKGIKILSELNLLLAGLLLLFVFFFGGKVVYLLQALIQNTGAYISDIINKTLNLYAYAPKGENARTQGWLGGWTIPYWGWWIAWSPFVGMFIARISRGRTIRNFVGGVLLIPAGFSFLWMTTFGNSAIDMISSGGVTAIKEAVDTDSALALFAFIENFPASAIVQQVVSFIAVMMVAVFFVTSADSGALVMDMLASKPSKEASPLWQRIFWSSMTGFIALVLMKAGGLGALQTVSTMSAFPFSIIILLAIYGLFKAFRVDYGKSEIRKQAQMYAQPSSNSGGWERRLRNLVIYPRRDHVSRFISAVVMPSFEEVKEEFHKQGIPATITVTDDCDIRLVVDHGENANFTYRVKARYYLKPDFGHREDSHHEDDPYTLPEDRGDGEDAYFFRAEVYLDDGSKGYDIMGYSKENISNDIVDQYTSHLYFIQNYQLGQEGSNIQPQ